MTYQAFAYIYDRLMDEAPYEEWGNYFLRQIEKYHPNCKRVLDVACGTGTLTLLLKEKGFDLTGVDLSEDMLAVAYEKAMAKGLDIPFYKQNMTNLEGIGKYDAVIIFCDSVNYLTEEEDFRKTFLSVWDCLAEGGLFLFDVHSVYKIEEVFQNQTFAYNGDDISYIWNSFPGEHIHSVEHELSFFVLDEELGLYRRYDEEHKQRTFPVETYEKWLKDTGFTLLSIHGDFLEEGPNETCERIFFTARKN